MEGELLSDPTLGAMSASLLAGDAVTGRLVCPEDPRDRNRAIQIMSAVWREFGRSVWVRYPPKVVALWRWNFFEAGRAPAT